jgi:hypothetical protein
MSLRSWHGRFHAGSSWARSVVTHGCAGEVHLFAPVVLIRERASMGRRLEIESRCDRHTLTVVEE